MAQVVRTTNQLILNALYLTGELGVGETPDQFMLDTGLDLLNETIDKLSAASIYIPYLQTLTSNFVYGKTSYSVSDMLAGTDISANRIVDLLYASYTVPSDLTGENVSSTTYPLEVISKNSFYTMARQNNLNSRPGSVYLDKQPYESFIVFYPGPTTTYQFSVQVKAMLNKFEAQDTLGELPPNYYGFLKYAIAKKFLSYYPSNNWTELQEKEYQDYYDILKNTNETDMSIRTSSLLSTNNQPLYWANIVSY